MGPSELALRLPAFTAGLVALAVMVPLARHAVGGRSALLAIACLALSRTAIRHGGEVKPYIFDLLLTECILLAFLPWSRARPGDGRGAAIGLLALAVFSPWASFPCAFVLGGVAAGAALMAIQSGGRRNWVIACALAVAIGASGLALWWVHARSLYYPNMASHWGPSGEGGFPNLHQPLSALLWPIDRATAIAGYGTREMGIPLVLLAVLGLRRLARDNAPFAVALGTTFTLAIAAAYLGKYPLANRTTTFLLPIVWIAAAAGVAEVAKLSPRFAVALVVVLLASDAVNMGPEMTRLTKFPQAREAIRSVRADRGPGDVVWASHVEIYQAYHGSGDAVYSPQTPPADVPVAAASGRVWVINNPSPFRSPVDDLTPVLRAADFREVERREFHKVVVSLYVRECPARSSGR